MPPDDKEVDRMKVSEVSYVSPAIRYDRMAGVVVFERRDAATGEVSYQVPSASAVAAKRVHAEPSTEAAPAPQPAAETPSPPPAEPPRGGLVSKFA